MVDASRRGPAMAAPPTRFRTERYVTLVWIAAIWAFALLGFGADLARFAHERPSPPPVLVLHGLFNVAWLALVTTQIVSAESGRLRLHRRLGWAAVAASAAMVPFGLLAALVDMARQAGRPDYAPQFLGEEFQDVAVFAACLAAGVALRRNRGEHARFMTLSALALADVGPGRIATDLFNAAPTTPFGVWATYYWGTDLVLAAMLAFDLHARGRVSRALAAGAALILGGEALTSILYVQPWWKAAMAALVRAWGWAG